MDESTAAHLTNGIDLEGEIKAEFVKAASVHNRRLFGSFARVAGPVCGNRCMDRKAERA